MITQVTKSVRKQDTNFRKRTGLIGKAVRWIAKSAPLAAAQARQFANMTKRKVQTALKTAGKSVKRAAKAVSQFATNISSFLKDLDPRSQSFVLSRLPIISGNERKVVRSTNGAAMLDQDYQGRLEGLF